MGPEELGTSVLTRASRVRRRVEAAPLRHKEEGLKEPARVAVVEVVESKEAEE